MDDLDAQSSLHLHSNDGACALVDPMKLVKDWYKDDISDEDFESKSELERYIKSSCELNSETFDMMKWWKDEKSNYKVHSLMAKDILAISISMVASESAFSTSD